MQAGNAIRVSSTVGHYIRVIVFCQFSLNWLPEERKRIASD